MNTGLQDAYNLGWKLGLVLSGNAGVSLLDTYEDERLPVAQRLLSTTDRGFSLIVSDSKLVGWFRTRPSFYLLRPDCYIGLCGTRLEPAAVKRYLGFVRGQSMNR